MTDPEKMRAQARERKRAQRKRERKGLTQLTLELPPELHDKVKQYAEELMRERAES